MGYETMLLRVPIRSAIRCGLLCAVAVPYVVRIAYPQSPATTEDAKSVLRLSEQEQREFVNTVMNAGFPDATGDRFSLLLVNRSALVVPMLESRVEQELKRSPRSEHFVEVASAMIAYAGDEESLRAISKLTSLDETKFGPLVGRTLDNAGNWRNPFTVAYQGLEIGNDVVSHQTATWAEMALASNRMQRAWAEAMLDRYGKAPVDSEWATDPIASRLKDRTSPELRQSVLRFATEVQTKRERR
jgi:hypothetical protein